MTLSCYICRQIQNISVSIKYLRIMKGKTNTTLVIGEHIKQELKRQGKTSVWLSEQLGCHRTNIYKVYGRSSIDTGMLYHISMLLNVDFFKLYSEALAKEKK